MIGKTISHYKILEKLGEGGMGVVYKAEDTKLKRFVALKFLPPDLTRDKEANERFIYEAQTASALDHQNICTIYEIDRCKGRMFIAMAYYQGETLKQKIARNLLSIEEVVDIAIQIARGLVKAHEKDIIHRDIKPGNIIVQQDGTVKIIDFGLSKLLGLQHITPIGKTMGTVAFMSAEQASGNIVDHRTDIWSLGVVLYEMLTGQLPFKGEHQQTVIYSILNKEPEPISSYRSDIPVALESVVDHSLAKNPDDRYQNMNELLGDLHSPEKRASSWTPKVSRSIGFGWLTRGGRRLVYGSFLIFIVITVLAALYMFSGRIEKIDSIAVLPFINMSAEPENDYLSDGMSEEIINDLTKIKGLRVVARTSSFAFKGTRTGAREIGKKLDVDALLEGSIRKEGNWLRINVQVIRVADGAHIWSQQYDRRMENMLDVQEELSLAIVDKLKIELGGEEKAMLVKRPTENIEAYQLYLKGRYFSDLMTERDIKKGLKYFNQAIAEDSSYALAYSGLAELYSGMGNFGLLPPADAYEKAKTAVEKALLLDDSLAEAHAAAALVKLDFEWSWYEVEKEFKRAFQLSPGSAAIYSNYSTFLVCMERYKEAVAAARKMQELDPLSPTANQHLGWIFFAAHQYEKSIVQLKKTLELYPNHVWAQVELAWNYAFKKMYPEAIVAADKVEELYPEIDPILHAMLYAISGNNEKALKTLNELRVISTQRYVEPVCLAVIHAGLGEKDQAFEWLNKAYDVRSTGMIRLKHFSQSWFKNLSSDPRYEELMRKVGFKE